MSGPADSTDRSNAHVAVAMLSFVVAVGLLAVKFWAYWRTNSQAIFSDALESIVNVVAALVALSVVRYAGQPADRDHPYGHGKLEFFSAAFEGGLIFCASILILWQAGQAFFVGAVPQELGIGVAITFAAGLCNGALGWFLIRYGRRHDSAALVADGHHVLSDFWTSLGVVLGLIAVRVTGIGWLDPLIAAVMMLWLLVTGWRIIRRAVGGLLDEEDPELVQEVVGVISDHLGGGVIRLHQLRAIRSGSFRYLQAHLVVPEFWSVERAHDVAESLSVRVVARLAGPADIEFHTDPCQRAWCSSCDLDRCPVRQRAFAQRMPLTVDEVVIPDRSEELSQDHIAK